MNAATSEPRNISPSPTPTTSGELRRAATIVPGLVGVARHQREVRPRAGGSTAASAAAKSPAVSPWRYCRGEQVRDDLGVGVAGELDAGGLQLGAQRGEVLDDPVVDDGDLAGGVAVRVGVAVGRAAVGGPAGVARCPVLPASVAASVSASAVSRLASLPARLAHGQPAVAVEHGDAGGVVAAVLQPAQPVDDDVAGGRVPDVADDSAHSHPG